jgi:hypothetical protein
MLTLTYRILLEVRTSNVNPYIQTIVRGMTVLTPNNLLYVRVNIDCSYLEQSFVCKG